MFLKNEKQYFDTIFLTQYIHKREKSKEKKVMKRKNITKLPLCMYCVRKVCQNIISLKKNYFKIKGCQKNCTLEKKKKSH
jgi:hypothetical protein